ncbi:uncharacterized protein [Penaeus vannamei]|uniref:uncharacterized protein n=1 Tax=Penaeus vannamei TaxID=6689 RepID=UPI00387F9F3D
MTGRGQEIVELMERRRINITFVQETKWKECKAREIGNGFKLFYNGSNGKREIVNIMSAYAPQMGCDEEEKTQFWEDLEEDLREIPESERLWIGGDFNGHCGSNNRGKEDTIGI